MKKEQIFEKYIMEAAQTPRMQGSPPLNAWTATSGRMKIFDGIYKDADIQSLTRPLKISIPHTDSHEDWDGMLVRSFIQTQLRMRGINCRPSGRTVIDYNRKGKRPHFLPTQRNHGFPNPKFSVLSSVYGRTKKGKKPRFDSFLYSKDGLNWIEKCTNGKEFKDDVMEKEEWPSSKAVRMAIGLQCFTEYSWTIEFQFENKSAPVLFPVTKGIAYSMARISDLTDSEKRRRVIHFVSEHKRSTGEREEGSSVMKHLRGELVYLWQGCRMQISPPVNDMYSFDRDTEKIKSVRKKMGISSTANI